MLATRERPRIADYLDAADPADHEAMFPELLALEVELRREGGESPGIDEYLAEYPDREAVIGRIFSELEPPQPSPDGREKTAVRVTVHEVRKTMRVPRRFLISTRVAPGKSAISRRSATSADRRDCKGRHGGSLSGQAQGLEAAGRSQDDLVGFDGHLRNESGSCGRPSSRRISTTKYCADL